MPLKRADAQRCANHARNRTPQTPKGVVVEGTENRSHERVAMVSCRVRGPIVKPLAFSSFSPLSSPSSFSSSLMFLLMVFLRFCRPGQSLGDARRERAGGCAVQRAGGGEATDEVGDDRMHEAQREHQPTAHGRPRDFDICTSGAKGTPDFGHAHRA